MSLRQHEIAEAGHRILNPLTDEKLDLLGRICRLAPGDRHLDLCCGKGEMLSRWSAAYQTLGMGIDISHVFLEAAVLRAAELGVTDQVGFHRGDARDLFGPELAVEPGAYDVVSCVGATWIGGGTEGTIALIAPALKPSGLMLIGEVYWIETPSAQVAEAVGVGLTQAATLAGTLDRFEAAGMELVEMVLADGDSWDRYVSGQWRTVDQWLRDHPGDPEAPGMRDFLDKGRRSHLTFGRRYLGWGVFVLRRRN
ncbi:class I SAM-dependent methyltransferase [Phenylobacterium sp.]|uniref:SAM-dependent methyltransferase n=1 Tax=Phenylobacterium sp. TaxID=1871053 RepID=UPI0030F375CA